MSWVHVKTAILGALMPIVAIGCYSTIAVGVVEAQSLFVEDGCVMLPNWWLNYYSVTEDYDEEDGVPAWKEYVADTLPRNASHYLHLTAVSNAPTGSVVAYTPASRRRYYTLVKKDDLVQGGWSNVASQVSVPYGAGVTQAIQDTNATAKAFYSIKVTVEP